MKERTGSASKIAILGGGAASLAAAFELTRPELSGRYDLTVYQMGWRLGGKGASGRNAARHDRIEEHGLHLWMGFYDNAFALMQAAYAELGRTSGPLQTWTDAFHPHDDVALLEPVGGEVVKWNVRFPRNGLVPGAGEEPALWELVVAILQLMHVHFRRSPCSRRGAGHPLPAVPDDVAFAVRSAELRGAASRPPRSAGFIQQIRDLAFHDWESLDHPVAALLASVHSIAASIPADARPSELESRALVFLVQRAMELLFRFIGDEAAVDFEARRLWVSVNLCGAAASGILADGVLDRGVRAIEHLDLREWLAKHGADRLTLDSAPMRSVYDLLFAYVAGDPARPRIGAGTALRGGLRMLFDYKGSIFYKMQAGMGDTVFTPLYEVLARRGVKFRFFHRVDALRVDPGTKLVDAVELTEQVLLAVDEYAPLVDIGGVPCWPSTPLYDQLRSGNELATSGIDLESSWAPSFRDARPKRLERGRDFDQIVLGISIGAFPVIARELSANSAAFADMVKNVETVQTCALQLWLRPDLAGLGFQDPELGPEAPVVGGIAEPLGTWADMSHLLARESWTPPAPHGIAYFCGVLDEPAPPPPISDHGFPARELARFDGIAMRFLKEKVGPLWPGVAGAGRFDWDVLASDGAASGPERLLSQYRRVNVDPSERYVLSVPGSSRFRLSAGESGIGNVVLAGDWTRCGLDAGCVEAAVTSGLLAARAISGHPRRIGWENDFGAK